MIRILQTSPTRRAGGAGYVVFTHDLDFGDILAATNADDPSVIQVRTQNLHEESAVEVRSAISPLL